MKPYTIQELDLMLKNITEKLSYRNITLNITDSAKEVILTKGYDVKLLLFIDT